MGKRSLGVHDASEKSKQAGGSDDRIKHRRLDFAEFSRFSARLGLVYTAVKDVPTWLLELFVWFLVAGAGEPGKIANKKSSLAVLKRTAGEDVSTATSSKDLKIARRDRSGKHRARTPEEFVDLVAAALNLNEGVMHVVKLMRFLGLRSREALMSGRSLERWRDLILQGERLLPVERGAKNGRERCTEVLSAHVEETLAVINDALAFCRERNFELITGCHGDLKSAKSRLKAFFDRLPMRGELGSHSLRYTYAVEFALALLDSGVDPVETLVRLADRLGHGPSRAQMCLNVYCKEIRHRFPEKIKLPSEYRSLGPAKPRNATTRRGRRSNPGQDGERTLKSKTTSE